MKYKPTGDLFAVKVILCHDESHRNDIRDEIDLLRQYRHANIVTYYGSVKAKSSSRTVY